MIDPLEAVPVADPGLDVAVYVVIDDPPVAPVVYVTETNPLNVVAVPIVGACGTVVIEIVVVSLAEMLWPTLLTAYILNLYPKEPSPVNVIDVLDVSVVLPLQLNHAVETEGT